MKHKRIGLIGGTTPESTVDYYKFFTGKYLERFGDHAYPEIIIFSVSFQQVVDWGMAGEWKKVEGKMVEAAQTLEKAGAEIIILTANTMHKFYNKSQASIGVPMISIIDTLIAAILAKGQKKVALLGTKPTMEESFYRDALSAAGIEALVPDQKDREIIHRIIYDELSKGLVTTESQKAYLHIADALTSKGAEGIILGCTEIPLILTSEVTKLTLYNTLEIHAEEVLKAAVNNFTP